ncbi:MULTISPECIES: GNAT family N-acetyltransferase [Nocardioides]|uniref:GNAT family N-acetyltransferase n=1 Tax=Nocardioides vastitatis TaxID=2568655 RepID=A0ABW0ZNC2_9ACTN|nr:GNAT family N-acetyltransferase [Nocardioides sp.]THI96653.1 GNAT family N-acetyltransferase [Nocardioides sp.]
MIRERRPEDLDRLCAVLAAMDESAPLLAGRDPREWLEESDAELSWVFDMAPVRVTPTKNVVGHVQVYRVDERDPLTSYWVDHSRRPAGDLLAVGRLFVRPDTYEHGIGRYLLQESVTYIRSQGKVPVLDLHQNAPFPKTFYERRGFEEISTGDPGVAVMIHATPAAAH